MQYFPISALTTLPIPVEPLSKVSALTNKVYSPGTTATVAAAKTATAASIFKKQSGSPKINAKRVWSLRIFNSGSEIFANSKKSPQTHQIFQAKYSD